MDVDLAAGASAIADPARAAMLDALLDGAPRSAGALAREAGVAPSTASHHLGRLLDAGLVTVAPDGRRRAFRLARPEVARALEALALISPARPARTLRRATRAEAERAARTCYDHLAGRLGVALMTAFVDRGVLTGGDGRHERGRARADRPSAIGRDLDYRLTDDGARRLRDLGVDVDGALAGPRTPIRYCVDWSEQAHHLSGALGAALATRMFELAWVSRLPRTRAVRLTDAGRAGLGEQFGVALP
jgi:DNA-binding transcriptional ArsR family regulator